MSELAVCGGSWAPLSEGTLPIFTMVPESPPYWRILVQPHPIIQWSLNCKWIRNSVTIVPFDSGIYHQAKINNFKCTDHGWL